MGDRLVILLAIVAVAAIVGVLVNALIRRRHHIERIDPRDFTAGTSVVVFTSPYCHGCRQWIAALEEDGVPASTIDVSERPDAAARYRISSTPRIAVVAADGKVAREFFHYEPRRSDLDQIAQLLGS
jgi:Flp pilus assembly protein CpaB